MTSWWCWVSWASWCFSTRFRIRFRFQSLSGCCWPSSRSGGVFSPSWVVFIALRVIAVLSHVLCPVSFLFLLQPTSTPTRSWDGERKPLRSVPWRRDTSTEFSCTSELSDWSFCLRETTRWAACGERSWVQSRVTHLLIFPLKWLKCVISVLSLNIRVKHNAVERYFIKLKEWVTSHLFTSFFGRSSLPRSDREAVAKFSSWPWTEIPWWTGKPRPPAPTGPTSRPPTLSLWMYSVYLKWWGGRERQEPTVCGTAGPFLRVNTFRI